MSRAASGKGGSSYRPPLIGAHDFKMQLRDRYKAAKTIDNDHELHEVVRNLRHSNKTILVTTVLRKMRESAEEIRKHAG